MTRGRKSLPQARKFKHLRLLFTNGRRMERWTVPDRCGEEPDHSFTGLFIYVPTLICGHDFWVRTRSQVQAAKMRLSLSSVGRSKLTDVVQSSDQDA